MKALRIALMALCAGVLVLGCKGQPYKPEALIPSKKPNYNRQLEPGEMALRLVTDPADIPDFTSALSDTTDLRNAIECSVDYHNHPSSNNFYPYLDITHEQVAQSLKAFRAMLDSGKTPQEMNAEIRKEYDVYTSKGCDDYGTVLFTGYYTPIFDAVRTRNESFKYPLCKMPDNLLKSPAGVTLGLKDKNGQVLPCPTRKEIESSGMFAGNEIFWLNDPFAAYIAQLQGSARLRLPDGAMVTVGYVANNGHDYQSVAEALVSDGKMRMENVSMQNVWNYFKAHPTEEQEYTWRNPRGCLNQPVTPSRSIATDKEVFPRAALAFVRTQLPKKVGVGIVTGPYEGFALDQDAGGAIRAAGRTDIYMGIGDDAADLAGRTYQEGRLYYIFLKQSLMTQPLETPAPINTELPAKTEPPVK